MLLDYASAHLTVFDPQGSTKMDILVRVLDTATSHGARRSHDAGLRLVKIALLTHPSVCGRELATTALRATVTYVRL